MVSILQTGCIELFKVMLYFLLQFIFILEDVFKPIVFVHWVIFPQLLKQLMLLYDQLFYLFTLEVFINFPLVQMPSQFLCMISEFILAFFYLANQGEERMIIFFLVQFLREERNNINIWLFFDIDNNIINFLGFALAKGDLDGLNWY